MECITAILTRDEDAIARLVPLRRYGKAVLAADIASGLLKRNFPFGSKKLSEIPPRHQSPD